MDITNLKVPPARNFKQINKNVWKLEVDGQMLSVKKYESLSTALKVKMIHETLRSISFLHIGSVLSHADSLLFIQPWMTQSRAVNFNKRSDRHDSLEALQQLHLTKNKVEWTSLPYLQPYPILNKWEDRFNRFSDARKACELYLGKSQVEEIIYYAREALKIVKKTYIYDENQTLLHGDVVHHNILRDQGNIIRFIDFDLACIGPAETEIALWIHRVLPHIDYDIEFLFQEQPSLKELSLSSKYLLLYPNEILREWLYFFSLSKAAQQRQLSNLIIFTESALSHWPRLWYNVERMNN